MKHSVQKFPFVSCLRIEPVSAFAFHPSVFYISGVIREAMSLAFCGLHCKGLKNPLCPRLRVNKHKNRRKSIFEVDKRLCDVTIHLQVSV